MTLSIEPEALRSMEAEGRSFLPLETGGVLLGWRTAGRTHVAVATGPGPRAQHRRRSFTPDADWQEHIIATAYEASERRVTYLGDWHTHPGGSPTLSDMDMRTLEVIACHPEARCPDALMLVLAIEIEVGVARLGAFRADPDGTRRAVPLEARVGPWR